MQYSEEANSRAEECEEASRLGAVDESLRYDFFPQPMLVLKEPQHQCSV